MVRFIEEQNRGQLQDDVGVFTVVYQESSYIGNILGLPCLQYRCSGYWQFSQRIRGSDAGPDRKPVSELESAKLRAYTMFLRLTS